MIYITIRSIARSSARWTTKLFGVDHTTCYRDIKPLWYSWARIVGLKYELSDISNLDDASDAPYVTVHTPRQGLLYLCHC